MKTILVAEDMRSAVEPCTAAHCSHTGCYVDGAWVNENFTLDNSVAPPSQLGLESHTAIRSIGGVQTGCDYQFPGGFVIGTAGDYDCTSDLTERRIC
jgi:hypothetical protein